MRREIEYGMRPFRKLSADEERALGRRIRAGARRAWRLSGIGAGERIRWVLTPDAAEAAATLVGENLRLAARGALAYQYIPRGWDREDLIGYGTLGLYEAALRFDPDRGIRFSTYAMLWVRQTISRSIHDDGRIVRWPQALGLAVAAARRGRTTLPEPMRARAEAALRVEIRHDERDLASLSAREPGPAEAAATEDELATLRAAIDRLPERSAEVLRARFFRDETLRQIARRLLLSPERVRQIEADAMRSIRRDYRWRLMSEASDVSDVSESPA